MPTNIMLSIAVWIAFHVSLVKGYEICNNLPNSYEQRCMDNGEIHFYTCVEIKVKDESIGIWKRISSEDKKCPKPNKCTCHTETHEEYDGIECRCVDPTERAAWPSTGVLRWHKTEKRISDYGGYAWGEEASVNTMGEVHQNGNGQYLKKWSEVDWDKADLPKNHFFKIIIPGKAGTFTKLIGSGENKNCSTSTVGGTGSIASSLPWYQSRKQYVLSSEKKVSNKISRQIWKKEYLGEYIYRYQWTVDYDVKRHISIPLEFVYRYSDYYTEYYETDTWKFTYEELKDSEDSFSVGDFCYNELW